MSTPFKKSKIEYTPMSVAKKKTTFPVKGLSIDSKIKREVQKQIAVNAEKKFTDRSLNLSGVDTVGQVVNLVGNISQGNLSVSNRIGDKIKVTSVQVRGNFAVADTTNQVRLIIYQWFNDGNVIVPSDILDATQVAAGRGVHAPFNYQNSGQYQVLYDRIFSVSSQGPAAVPFDFKIKKIPRNKVKYSGASTTPVDNSIVLLQISDSGISSHPTVSWVSRVYYTDE